MKESISSCLWAPEWVVPGCRWGLSHSVDYKGFTKFLDGGTVRQLSVKNATASGWPGLIAFDNSPGNPPNCWYMVQDGEPVRTKGGRWLLPMYGLLNESVHDPNPKPPWGPGPALAPAPSPVTALLTNADDTLAHWEFVTVANDGNTRCNYSDARARPQSGPLGPGLGGVYYCDLGFARG